MVDKGTEPVTHVALQAVGGRVDLFVNRQHRYTIYSDPPHHAEPFVAAANGALYALLHRPEAAPSKGTEQLTPEAWSFIPDLCGGFMRSPTGDKWYPEGHEHQCVAALRARLSEVEVEAAVAWKERALAAERERDEARAIALGGKLCISEQHKFLAAREKALETALREAFPFVRREHKIKSHLIWQIEAALASGQDTAPKRAACGCPYKGCCGNPSDTEGE